MANVGSKTAQTSSPPTIKNSPHLFGSSESVPLNISFKVSASDSFVTSSKIVLKLFKNFKYSSSIF